MHQTSVRLPAVPVLLLALLGLLASAEARAQGSIGVGPHLSIVRGDEKVPESSSAKFIGGILRARLSPRTAIELSLDYRSQTNDTQTERTVDYPFQGSLLLYPIRSALSAYVLGGIGWYSQRVETLDDNQAVLTSTTTRKVGYHAGLGGELQLGRHAAAHLDYRYTLIHFGDQSGTPTSPGAIPVPGLTGLQEKLKLSHEGSMWTTGVTFYF